MKESRIDATYLRKGDNVATGHQPQADGTLLPVAPLAWKNNAGAVGIYSSTHDMALWMRALLDDTALLRAESRRRMWSMITPIDIDPPSVPELAAAQPTALGYGGARGRGCHGGGNGEAGRAGRPCARAHLHAAARHSVPRRARGQVDAETRRKLDWLASQGRLSGHWKPQAVLAEGIVSRRKPRAARA